MDPVLGILVDMDFVGFICFLIRAGPGILFQFYWFCFTDAGRGNLNRIPGMVIRKRKGCAFFAGFSAIAAERLNHGGSGDGA